MLDLQKKLIGLSVFWLLLIASVSHASDNVECEKYGLVANEDGWCVPKIKLEGDLAKIFTIPTSKCHAISGLTCRIHYNGQLPLPSEVFFVELDANGKTLEKPIRLIYPQLKKGETGYATFKIKQRPATIVLTGKWEGPWKSPY